MRSWVTASPEPAKCFVAVLLLAVFHLICPDSQRRCRVGTRDVPFHNQDRLQRSLNSEGCSWFPACRPPAPPLHSMSHWTSPANVQRFVIHQHAYDVVQFCDMSRTVRSHLERPRSPSFLSILFSSQLVSLRHEFHVNQAPLDLTSSCVIVACCVASSRATASTCAVHILFHPLVSCADAFQQLQPCGWWPFQQPRVHLL